MGRTTEYRPTAEEALQTLMEGNKGWVTGKLEHPNHIEENRQAVATGEISLLED